MVSLFEVCWPELRKGQMTAKPQNFDEGTLHYKRDFEGILEALPNGWNTKIKDI